MREHLQGGGIALCKRSITALEPNAMMEFFSGILLAKALVSISVVVGLSLVAERVGLRAAGLLTGLPLGAGMIVVFTGLEQGATFAGIAAGFTVPGFATTLVFIYLYAAVAVWRNRGGLPAGIEPAIAADAGYAGAAALAGMVQPALWVSLPVMAVLLVAASRLMAYLPNTPIGTRVHFGLGVALFRAGTATLAILIISGIAGLVGPQWTGIFAAYPLTLFPLIVVIHAAYTGEQVAAMLKHIPLGLGSVISFCVTVTYAVPAVGLALSVVAGYVVSLIYLVVLSCITRVRVPGVA